MKFETEQELFNHIVAHAASMDGPSIGEGSRGRCQYRGHNGNKCLVGACIPDEDYRLEMEGYCVNTLYWDGLLPHLENYIILLDHCQMAHDGEADDYATRIDRGYTTNKDHFRAELLERLRGIAEEFNLDFVLPNEGDK